MIIVEGPDGAGKSTLVERIEADWNLTREPRAVSSAAETLTPIDRYIEAELAKGFGMRLYDRFALISSPMYMMLPEPTFDLDLKNFEWLQMQYVKLEKIDPVIIYCLPPFEVVRANVAKEDNSGGKIVPNIDQIYWNYHAFAARQHNSSHMVWDYTKPNVARLSGLMRWAAARVLRDNEAWQEERGTKWKKTV